MFAKILSLPATIWLLGLISLLNDATGELIYPLLPLYIASVLMAGPKALGLIEGMAEATSSLLKLISGVMVDRIHGAKWWVAAGYAAAAVSRPLLALARSWPMVLLLRLGDRFGKGLRSSPRDALLAQVVPPEQRGLAYGFHRSMDNAGSVIGPVIAAVLLARHMPIREIFLWASIPGLFAVGLALWLKEPARELVVKPKPFSWNLRSLPPAFRRYLVALGLFTLGNASNTFLLLRASRMGLADYEVPLLWALVAFTAMLFSTPFSALSDRIGRFRLIIGGWVVYAVFYLLLGYTGGQRWLLWPLFAFYGLFMAATEGAERALVADLAPPELVGTAFGWFNLVAGIMLLPASILFGWIWQLVSPQAAFTLAATCAGLAAVLLKYWVIPVLRRPPE
jgi:MFS family permease